MASASIFLSLSAACYIQEPYPPMYGVWLSCLGGLNSKEECQDTSHTKLNCPPHFLFLVLSSLQGLATSGIFFILNFFPLASTLLKYKKKEKKKEFVTANVGILSTDQSTSYAAVASTQYDAVSLLSSLLEMVHVELIINLSYLPLLIVVLRS